MLFLAQWAFLAKAAKAGIRLAEEAVASKRDLFLQQTQGKGTRVPFEGLERDDALSLLDEFEEHSKKCDIRIGAEPYVD